MVISQTQYFRRYDINCSTCVVGRDRIVGSKHLPLAELSAMTLSTTSNIRWSNGWRTCKKSCIHQNKQKLHAIKERYIWCHASNICECMQALWNEFTRRLQRARITLKHATTPCTMHCIIFAKYCVHAAIIHRSSGNNEYETGFMIMTQIFIHWYAEFIRSQAHIVVKKVPY
jgi:hypothetical protein